MVHIRLNESESNPNPYINFITALPMSDDTETESARQLLRALAAQVKPVMKSHGFAVNSFEEYEYNRVFAGRNWNNGETIELVLRRANGFFESPSWLMSTLCHELAHIKHMNHGSAFQALWSQLRNEVKALQARGYYGDGLWSAGTRLADSARMAGDGAEVGDLPEYICGGAQATSRPSRRRRVRQPRAGPSKHTGAQTAKKRKPGSRVRAADAFVGEGRALNADIIDKDQKKVGSGFGKRAQRSGNICVFLSLHCSRSLSKRAREERAAAVERRLLALQGKYEPPEEGGGDSDTDVEIVEIPETDQDRRRALGDSTGREDLSSLRSGDLTDFWGDFIVNRSTATTEDGPSRPQAEPTSSPRQTKLTSASGTKSGRTLGIGRMVQEEIRFRKAEALGMEPRTGGRTLGSSLALAPNFSSTTLPPSTSTSTTWVCGACTLQNEPLHLVCAACGTMQGESWKGSSN
ncbi:WLM domain-containing protein [Vararia minispora EC-137]|uniref:WLM domain-containing protein n=1 Tax=Vararia minispora EC-137 TaxID=1314806 RepID=A0ACB8QTI5_9AGAM|nr:WLM domain-containing protein [Vararia minispora EC-137]